MELNEAEVIKRRIPCDKPVKLALLFAHFAGFSIWYGGTVTGATIDITFVLVTVSSGVLLSLREVFKHGFVWVVTTEGVFTVAKIIPLALCAFTDGHEVFLLTLVLALGFVGSRLPERRIL